MTETMTEKKPESGRRKFNRKSGRVLATSRGRSGSSPLRTASNTDTSSKMRESQTISIAHRHRPQHAPIKLMLRGLGVCLRRGAGRSTSAPAEVWSVTAKLPGR